MGKGRVVEFRKPGDTVEDALTEVLHQGARKLLAEAIEVEVEDFINQHSQLRNDFGHRRVVRNGHLPGREIMTGIGAVEVSESRSRGSSRPISLQRPALEPNSARGKGQDQRSGRQAHGLVAQGDKLSYHRQVRLLGLRIECLPGPEKGRPYQATGGQDLPGRDGIYPQDSQDQ